MLYLSQISTHKANGTGSRLRGDVYKLKRSTGIKMHIKILSINIISFFRIVCLKIKEITFSKSTGTSLICQ